jgi:ribosomal-protein-alanine N-acetyltransferase
MQFEDVPGVAALAAEEPVAPHWPTAEYYRMLEVIAESPRRRGAWVLRTVLDRERRSVCRLPRDRPGVIGFAMASSVAGICDLEAVVVGAAWRGRGYGEALVQAAADWGLGLGATRLELEVRVSNAAALRLYQRMGFAVEGRRPGYYRNPEEDAVLMSLRLGGRAG